MGRLNAGTTFSKGEIEEIETLVRQLENAPADKQKGIRAKIRRIGLYWSEVAEGTPYTVQNFHKLINSGIIKVKGTATQMPVAFTTTNSIIHLSQVQKETGRTGSDEYYVVGLCNEALGIEGLQQYKFPFLLGDSGRALPVDVYYPDLKLVVEYYERQHTEEVKFFNRRMTVSGVSRGEQRRIYDERRRTELPKHGIKLLIISYTDFGTTKTLSRNHDSDLNVVKSILKKNGIVVKPNVTA